MADECPQYFENTLVPFPVNKTTLSNALHDLRAAVRRGAELVHANDPLPEKWGVGGMFKHFPGTKPYQKSRLLRDAGWMSNKEQELPWPSYALTISRPF